MRHPHLHWPDDKGTAALEFALVALPLFSFIVAVVIVAFYFYLQFALDFATQSSVRQVLLGNVPNGTTAAQFEQQYFCPIFNQFAPCSSVYLNLVPVANFLNDPNVLAANGGGAISTGSFVFCPGSPGQLVYVQALYLAPIPTGLAFGPTSRVVDGVPRVAITANAAFADQNPNGRTVPAGGGC